MVTVPHMGNAELVHKVVNGYDNVTSVAKEYPRHPMGVAYAVYRSGRVVEKGPISVNMPVPSSVWVSVSDRCIHT